MAVAGVVQSSGGGQALTRPFPAAAAAAAGELKDKTCGEWMTDSSLADAWLAYLLLTASLFPVFDPPQLLQHKMTLMRDKKTTTRDFRHLMRELTLYLG